MSALPPAPLVVALVPAKDRADRVAATVTALWGLPRVDRVLVVDDGSRDDTARVARDAGAEVLRLPSNRGKGGAVLAGVAATPEADVYLLIDADLATTAGAADTLLDPVLADRADLVIGVLPPAAGRGGSGRVKALAGRGIARATGRQVREPLSGQRAVRRELLVGLTSAERFGLEVAMTIDAERAGARILEVDVPMDHLHTGGSWGGRLHRARQGVDVARALWSRLTTSRQRLVGIGLVLAMAALAALWQGERAEPSSTPLAQQPDKVVVFAINPMGFSDLGRGLTPNLDRAIDKGAVAAMSVRTASRRPRLAEGYVSLGAGYRLRSPQGASIAYPSDEEIGNVTAGEVLRSRTGEAGDGEIAVIGAAATLDINDDSTTTSKPGALGDALGDAGRVGAVVGNGDRLPVGPADGTVNRPAALALMDSTLSVPTGSIQPADLLNRVPSAPYGVRSSPDKMMAAIDDAAQRADVIFVDPGDLDRADAFRGDASATAQSRARTAAMLNTDAILGRVLDWAAGDDVTVMVVSVAPPGSTFRLTPMVVVGPGVPHGYVVSPSTKRAGLVALTDVAPTILDAVGVDVPSTMPGRALEYQAADVDLDVLGDYDRGTNLRERTYYSQAVWFIVFQAITYGFGVFVLSRRANLPRSAPVLRLMVMIAATFPLATFLFRALPMWSDLPVAGGALILVGLTVGIAWLASRARRTPLSPLNWVLAATVGIIALDCATGTWLHVNSWLGYSLHSAGRFYGVPNTTFAVVAASAILLACSHVQFAPRRREAVATATALLAFVVLVDGAPSLGGDVGGILTLVPVFGLLLWVLAGRRLRVRTLAVVGAATLVALSLAAGVDLARPPASRTHLGRFTADLLDNGPSELTTTFLRKQDANFRILQVSIWTWLIPIVAGFLLYVLVYERQWSALLPRGGALRAGVVAVISGSLLGFLANDSGPIVIALFFAYLGPYLTLLALHRKGGRPELLTAPSDEPPPPLDGGQRAQPPDPLLDRLAGAR
ncbi:MAG TPA: glycosyltransferase [Acidimicrobiales bacterium]|nr:glycosyltransferase [Acidimicrobiales bacterium]